MDDTLAKLATVARDIITRKVARGVMDADAFAAGTFLLLYEERQHQDTKAPRPEDILTKAATRGLRGKGADAVQEH